MRKAHGWAVVTMAAMVTLAGCGDAKSPDAGAGAGGGVASTLRSVAVVTQLDATRQPLDAVPSPDGTDIYLTTTGDAGPAVLVVHGTGSTTSTVAQGAPLTRPTGIAMAADGVRVFLADGAIFNLPVVTMVGGDPAPAVVPDTEGWSARGLDVVGDDIFFTGTDRGTGKPGLFQVSIGGGAVATVAEGGPFVAPDSVVVDAHGVAYVTDQGTGPGQGQVLRVDGGSITPVLTGLRLGSPAGVTLVHDDATLLVSSVAPVTHANQVIFLQLATGATTSSVVGEAKDSAGGLHRAQSGAVLAWADVSRSGRVYRVEL